MFGYIALTVVITLLVVAALIYFVVGPRIYRRGGQEGMGIGLKQGFLMGIQIGRQSQGMTEVQMIRYGRQHVKDCQNEDCMVNSALEAYEAKYAAEHGGQRLPEGDPAPLYGGGLQHDGTQTGFYL